MYEVRSAGRSMRLYSNGVFHSQYNPAQVVTHGVWDLLSMASFFQAADSIKRILVLGVGGGAVIHQLNLLLKPQAIVGVEMNPIHVQVAKKFFAVNYRNLKLHTAEAGEWVRNYGGEKFDMIIDDLFMEREGEPVRAIAADAGWFRQLSAHLSAQGLLVMNFVAGKELRQSAYLTSKSINRSFVNAYAMVNPREENVVAVFCRRESSKKYMLERLQQEAKFHRAWKNGKIATGIRKLPVL